MSEDAPPIELWVLLTEAALVLVGAWIWEGGVARIGQFFASWALTTALLAFVAGAMVPWTRGIIGSGRALVLTLTLGACGAMLTALTMAGILALTVIRTGLSASEADLWQAIVIGAPSGAGLGAAAGLLSGAVLSVTVLVVDGIRRVGPNELAPPPWKLVIMASAACAVLAGVAELQHWAPIPTITGCSAGCVAWFMLPGSRILGSGLFAVAVGFGALLLLDPRGRSWRAPLGCALLVVGVLSAALGHTVFTSTTGPRFRRATLGLPPMPLPLSRELVDAQVEERPGWLLHTAAVRWPDGEEELLIVGVGPFRPRTTELVRGIQTTAEGWQQDRMPGRMDEVLGGDE